VRRRSRPGAERDRTRLHACRSAALDLKEARARSPPTTPLAAALLFFGFFLALALALAIAILSVERSVWADGSEPASGPGWATAQTAELTRTRSERGLRGRGPVRRTIALRDSPSRSVGSSPGDQSATSCPRRVTVTRALPSRAGSGFLLHPPGEPERRNQIKD
jgi:hypothetical protein